MYSKLIKDDIFLLSKNIKGILFEAMWEMPSGVTLNSYIVKGEKTAIIDGFCGWDGYPESLYKLLEEVDVKLEDIKYLVINHMEPDHSGWIEDFRKLHKDFEILCSKESAALLEAFYSHTENVKVVGDNDSVDLGGGKVLEFYKTPHVHWPDTIATLEKSSGILFTCDNFGSFGTADEHFDDELSDKELKHYENEARRYYAAVLGAFSPMLKRAVQKIEKIPFEIIAPGHGIIWRKEPNRILEDYKYYADCNVKCTNKKATVLYGSMYEMSLKVLPTIEEVLKEKGFEYNLINVIETDYASVLMDVLTSSAIIVLAPTYEYKMYPPMINALKEIALKKLTGRAVLYTGSFGWSGGAFKELKELSERERTKWDIIGDYGFKGSPSEEDLEKLRGGLVELTERI